MTLLLFRPAFGYARYGHKICSHASHIHGRYLSSVTPDAVKHGNFMVSLSPCCLINTSTPAQHSTKPGGFNSFLVFHDVRPLVGITMPPPMLWRTMPSPARNNTVQDVPDPCFCHVQLPAVEDVEYWHSAEKEGWMQSQGDYLSTWRKRWFVLKQGYLFRYVCL